MSAQEERLEIIKENIPKLIKSLTNFDEDDEYFHECEQFAYSFIQNHRNLSTNSHEIRRKIEGIQEKFQVDNFAEYADHLGRLCDEIIEHPLCREHYEIDVQWSLLDFLFTLAYNPTGALRRNKPEIDLSPISDDEVCKTSLAEIEVLKDLLREDFLPVEHLNSDSDLSDWSDTDEVSVKVSTWSNKPNDYKFKRYQKIKLLPHLSDLKPPERINPFTTFRGELSEENLLNNIQNSWWLPTRGKNSQASIESKRIEANFAIAFTQHLTESSNNLIRFEEPSTVAEYCFLREFIWMCHAPVTCKFFTVTDNKIEMNDDVTIPSVSASGFKSFVECNLLPYLQMIFELRTFIDNLYEFNDVTLTKTLECYASSLRSLLSPLWNELIAYEHSMIEQPDYVIHTVIDFYTKFKTKGLFKHLEILFDIHQSVTLNSHNTKCAPHIVSTYLLTNLLEYNNTASNSIESNMTISLFLMSVKVFCIIIDTWWSVGCLDDFQNEFIVERMSDVDYNVGIRLFHKDKDKSFFVPVDITKAILANDFFKLLLGHSLEAGNTLNLLYELNRISDLKFVSEVVKERLFDAFLKEVIGYANSLQKQLNDIKGDNLDVYMEMLEKTKKYNKPKQRHFIPNQNNNDEDITKQGDRKDDSLPKTVSEEQKSKYSKGEPYSKVLNIDASRIHIELNKDGNKYEVLHIEGDERNVANDKDKQIVNELDTDGTKNQNEVETQQLKKNESQDTNDNKNIECKCTPIENNEIDKSIEDAISIADSGIFQESIQGFDIIDSAFNIESSIHDDDSDTDDDILRHLTTNDEFLRMTFASSNKGPIDISVNNVSSDSIKSQDKVDTDEKKTSKNQKAYCDMNALDIFNELNKTEHLLPLNEIIHIKMSNILKSRIDLANSFVIKLYREEYNIFKHLRNIRKILLFELSDVMHQFYMKLFHNINTNINWENSSLLTMILDDTIAKSAPDLTSLFRIDVKKSPHLKSTKIYDHFDGLVISYNLQPELEYIITPDNMKDYNRVFRFILKVKWGLQAIEHLSFPPNNKKPPSYAPLQLIDLIMRRLQILRSWMIYALDSIHFHLMAFVLQSMGTKLEEQLEKCTNLKEMKNVHKSYLSTVCEHCFLEDNYNNIKIGIEQLLNLAYILCMEWNSCLEFISDNNPLALHVSDIENCASDAFDSYISNSDIDAIESTYVRCHQYLANKLNYEVYVNQKTFLAALNNYFNASMPY